VALTASLAPTNRAERGTTDRIDGDASAPGTGRGEKRLVVEPVKTEVEHTLTIATGNTIRTAGRKPVTATRIRGAQRRFFLVDSTGSKP